MNECRKVKRLLSRYLDKETGNADTVLIKTHLDRCSLCKQELSELAHVKEFILGRERKILPQDYLICRLQEKTRAKQYASEWLPLADIGNLARRFIPVPVAAIVVAIVFLALSSRPYVSKYLLEDHILSGNLTTTDTALKLVLGVQNQIKGGVYYE